MRVSESSILVSIFGHADDFAIIFDFRVKRKAEDTTTSRRDSTNFISL